MIPLRHVASINWNSDMGKILRDRRERKSLSRRVLSEQVGCSESLIEKLETVKENETRSVTLQSIKSLLGALDEDLDILFLTIHVKIP